MFFHASGESGSSSGKGNGGLMSFIFGGQNDDKPRQVTSPVKLPQVPDTVRQSVEPTDREKIELQIIKVSFLEFSRKLLIFFYCCCFLPLQNNIQPCSPLLLRPC